MQREITLMACPKCSYYEYDNESFTTGKPRYKHWRKNLQRITFDSIGKYLDFLQKRYKEVK